MIKKTLSACLFVVVINCLYAERYVGLMYHEIDIVGNDLIYSVLDTSILGLKEKFVLKKTEDIFGFALYEDDKSKMLALMSDLFLFTFDAQKTFFYGSRFPEKFRNAGYYFRKFQSAKASSYYSEQLRGNVIEYSAENLLDYELLTPWVTNVEGGQGESLSLETPDVNFDALLLINGFVSVEDPSLYEKNSRIKKCIIRYDDIEQEVEIKDTPRPQLINLQKTTDSIEILVDEVYRGSMYSDLSVAGIFNVQTWLIP